MKIGFTGSHGTGKTSLMEALKVELKGYDFIGSTSRMVKDMGLPINQEATPYSQLLIANMRDLVEDNKDNFVSDRTALDSAAYTLYQYENVWIPNEEATLVLEVSERIARENIKKYDKVFYFPPLGGEVKSDGTRPTDIEYQRKHDQFVRWYLAAFGVDFITISPGSIKDRVVHVLSMIQ